MIENALLVKQVGLRERVKEGRLGKIVVVLVLKQCRSDGGVRIL